MYFGFNEDGWRHQAHPWAPSQLNPDAFRFGVHWDDVSSVATSVCANMNLGAYTTQPGRRIGIMTLTPGVAGALPNYSQYNAAITRWVNDTAAYPNLYIQVWNEPNNPTFGGFASLTVRGFISAAKAAGGSRVLGPAMAPISGWQQYMSQAYADKVISPAVHVYPTSSPWTGDWDVAIKEAGNNNPSPTGPIWITEIGLRYSYFNGANWVTLYGSNWAQYTIDAHNRAINQSNLAAICFHRLVRVQSSPFDEYGRLYFINEDGTLAALGSALDPYR